MSVIENYPASKFPLTLAEFRAELESRDRKEVIGEACIAGKCPIAKVLKQQWGGWDAFVCGSGTGFGGNNYENPEWVRKFVYRIDLHKNNGEYITVEEALEVVNSIEE